MNILIADDDASTLYIAGRLVTQHFHCNALTAHNGLEALETLQRETVDILVLDIQMPLLGGLETLRIIRESPKWTDLPVVVLSATKEESLVRELISLGVRDFVVKPLGDRFAERFEQVVKAVQASGGGSDGRPRAKAAVDLSRVSTMLIADGDSNYRQFFRKNVGSRFKIEEAESGVKALEICLKHAPDVAFLGTDLGAVSAEHIVRHLRASNRRSMLLIGVPLKSEATATRAAGLFDDVFLRTYVPGSFKAELGRLLERTTAYGALCELVPDIRGRLLRCVEQVFGMMLAADVETTQHPAPCAEPRVWAAIPISSSGFVVTIRIALAARVAKDVAAAFLETEAEGLAADDIASVAGEVINVIAGRLQVAFQERRLELTIGLPTSGVEAAAGEGVPGMDALDVDVHFMAIDRPVAFEVGMSVQPAKQGVGKVDEESGVTVLRSDG